MRVCSAGRRGHEYQWVRGRVKGELQGRKTGCVECRVGQVAVGCEEEEKQVGGSGEVEERR